MRSRYMRQCACSSSSRRASPRRNSGGESGKARIAQANNSSACSSWLARAWRMRPRCAGSAMPSRWGTLASKWGTIWRSGGRPGLTKRKGCPGRRSVQRSGRRSNFLSKVLAERIFRANRQSSIPSGGASRTIGRAVLAGEELVRVRGVLEALGMEVPAQFPAGEESDVAELAEAGGAVAHLDVGDGQLPAADGVKPVAEVSWALRDLHRAAAGGQGRLLPSCKKGVAAEE